MSHLHIPDGILPLWLWIVGYILLIIAYIFAFKTADSTHNPLSDYEIGILSTTAGIPYRDEFLNSSADEILNRRKQEAEISGRMTSSRFMKNLNIKKY